MEDRFAWLSDVLSALGWFLLAGLIAVVAWWIWQKRLHRFLLLNGGHGLATITCCLLFLAVLSSIGPTDGFGAWSLVPLALATPPVALALIVWGLIARSRHPAPANRWTALAFTGLALIPLVTVILIVFGGG